MLRHSRQTIIGIQPDTQIPFELDGRKSAVRLKKTHRFEVAPPRWVPIAQPKRVSNPDAQFIAFGIVCLLISVAMWVCS